MPVLVPGQEIGIHVIRGRYKGFFDGAYRCPAQEIKYRTRLVVGARASGSAKRLLAYHSSGRFVVDVEIARCVHQLFGHFLDVIPVLRKDGSGQAVNRGTIQQIEGGIQFFVFIHVNGKYRPEQFLDHGDVIGLFGQNHRGLDKIAHRFVAVAARKSLRHRRPSVRGR